MTVTANKGLWVPLVGGESGTWGGNLNTLNFALVDTMLGGVVTKTLTNVNVTLSAAESQNAILRLTGTLSGNVVITTACVGFTFIENLTTGAYSVTFTNGIGSPVTLPQGYRVVVITDGTNGARYAVTAVNGVANPYFPMSYLNTPQTVTLVAANAGNGYLCDTSAGNINFVLPLPSTMSNGTGFFWKKLSGTGNLTITVNTGTIDGVSSITLKSYSSSIYLISDGVNWFVFDGSFPYFLASEVQSVTATGATAIDMNLGWNVALTLTGAATLTFTNWPTSGTLGRCVLDVTSSGSFNITWPATTYWSGGVAPTVTPSGKDTFIITSSVGGSPWRGFIAAQAMA